MSLRSNENPHPGQQYTFKKHVTSMTKTSHLSPRYGHVILASGYLILTAVNWQWNGSPISKCKDVTYMHKLTQVNLNLFFGCHLVLSNKDPQRLHLSLQYGHVTLVSRFLVLTAVNWHEYPMPFSWCELLCDLMFNKPAWLRSLCLLAAAVAGVGDSMHPQAIPLATLTMKKEIFPGFTISMHVFLLFLQFP